MYIFGTATVTKVTNVMFSPLPLPLSSPILWWQVTDIHSLLSSQLVEPQVADIMHELQQHKDLQLV